MSITRVTSVVMESNAISEDKIANSSISDRHLSNTSVNLRHLAADANFTTSINTVTANVNIVQDNLNTTSANVSAVIANVNLVSGNVITDINNLTGVDFGPAGNVVIINEHANGIVSNGFINIGTGGVTFNQSYTFPTSDGTADQLLSTDGAGQLSFVDVSSIQVPSFLVFGQAAALTNQTSQFEAKTTNGAQNGQGWRLPLGGKVTHLSAQLDVTTASTGKTLEVELFKNGSGTGKTISVGVGSTGDAGAHGSITEETFSAGDRLMVKFKHSGTGVTTQAHAFTIRILLST